MSHLQLTTYGDVSPSTFEMDFATKLIKTQDLYERSQLDDATSPERANDIGYADTHRSSMQYNTQRSSLTNADSYQSYGDSLTQESSNTSPSNSSTYENDCQTHTSFHSSLHDTKYYPMGDKHYPMTTMRFQIGSPPLRAICDYSLLQLQYDVC